MHTAANEAPPLARFCATVAEQQALALDLVKALQLRLGRLGAMTRIIHETIDDLPDTAENSAGYRILVCSDVIAEALASAHDDAEAIEKACATMGAALRGEAPHA
jgi:hypothetical protein